MYILFKVKSIHLDVTSYSTDQLCSTCSFPCDFLPLFTSTSVLSLKIRSQEYFAFSIQQSMLSVLQFQSISCATISCATISCATISCATISCILWLSFSKTRIKPWIH